MCLECFTSQETDVFDMKNRSGGGGEGENDVKNDFGLFLWPDN